MILQTGVLFWDHPVHFPEKQSGYLEDLIMAIVGIRISTG